MTNPLKGVLASICFFAALGAAEAKPTNYHPCLDVAGQGFGGLACTVAANDVFNFGGGDIFKVHNSGNDHQTTVEAALRWVFGDQIDLFDGVHGLERDQAGFDFSPNNITNESSFPVELDQAFSFATVKASTFFIIFDVRGVTSLDLGTLGYIHNISGGPNPDKGPIDVSHVSFWNADLAGPGPGPAAVPVPGTIVLLTFGVLVLAACRRPMLHRRARHRMPAVQL